MVSAARERVARAGAWTRTVLPARARAWSRKVWPVKAWSPVAAAVAIVIVALALTALGGSIPSRSALRASLVAYRGFGTWVDIYDKELWDAPRASVQAMHALGVRTLFLETANFNAPNAIFRPKMTQKFIHEAHRLGMRVVAWYLPGLQNLEKDFQRSMAAVRFETSLGQRFDSFGLDIEATVVGDPTLRNNRLLHLSRRIRNAVGPGYALGAIIPSPRGMELRPEYWPNFPFADLAEVYDVFVPMGYFAYRVFTGTGAHNYTERNIDLIREGTGDPNVPIHVIGGIADDISTEEARGFVRAARERGVLGASLYDHDTSGPEDWSQLGLMPANPRQSPALPVPIGFAYALGNIPGGDRTHPKEVFFRSGGMAGAWSARFEAYDLQAGEVELWVNWRLVVVLEAGPEGAWSGPLTVLLPDAVLRDTGTNYVHFAAVGNHPEWSVWGVRAVTLVAAGS